MLQEYKSKFPKWCSDDTTPFSCCLSDDLDSLLSCRLLEKIKGYPINYFYDFTNLYQTENANGKALGVDIDFTTGRCWGNHVTLLSENNTVNTQCAGLNNVCKINRNNYTSKYAGSVLAQIISFYDVLLPQNEKQLMFLLCVDSGFKGYYSGFRTTNIKWLEVLQMEPMIEILKKHTIEDFEALQKEYKMNKKIYLDEDGFLKSELPLEKISDLLGVEVKLPDEHFEIKNKFIVGKTSNFSRFEVTKNIVSLALTYKNYAKFTYKGVI